MPKKSNILSKVEEAVSKVEEAVETWRGRSLTAKKKKLSTTAIHRAQPYHAVAIKVPSEGTVCEAARALSGKRFLSDEAPKLPLQECDAEQCECTYTHYADRRHENRRAGDAGMSEQPFEGDNKRARGPDRRRSERDADPDDTGEMTYKITDYFHR